MNQPRVDLGRPSLWVRWGTLSWRIDWRSLVVCASLALVVVALALVALATGSYRLTVGQVWSALTGAEGGLVRQIVVEWRLPRVVATLVFGAALGVSGAIFHSLTRNSLASPDVIGFSTGSYTGALIMILIVDGGYLLVATGALVGGIATAIVVYGLSWGGRLQGFRLIVVGIAVSAMLGALNTWMILKAELDVALSAAAWGAGSLNGVSWGQVGIGGALIAGLLILAGALSRPMRQMELGDDLAASHGVRIADAKLGLIVVGVALTATVTAASGPIAFIALAAPQIGRRLARTAGITLAPAAWVGALLLGAADFLAQHLAPTPLPVGVVTVVIGGGYLGWLIFAEVRSRL